MRKQHNQEAEPSTTVNLWNYATARKAVPYLRTVVRSLREDWLELQRARRQLQRLDSRPGRPDRQALIRQTEAARDIEQARGELEETLDELKALDVFSLAPAQGQALIPFAQGTELAWLVFDLFAPEGLEAWRFHGDPLETRRPLIENSGAALPTPGVP